ncbi:LAFE_0F17128g1_1 [Lachancea fermentati]|uniref:LAFE_0F17128g1_1 n=1 Tax=Lachancea fermentati TaxID=4955 RepID=A0A1G4MGS3_LACFM|nr:LAFE_0F17128g1_1 [Lachancea fermentati]
MQLSWEGRGKEGETERRAGQARVTRFPSDFPHFFLFFLQLKPRDHCTCHQLRVTVTRRGPQTPEHPSPLFSFSSHLTLARTFGSAAFSTRWAKNRNSISLSFRCAAEKHFWTRLAERSKDVKTSRCNPENHKGYRVFVALLRIQITVGKLTIEKLQVNTENAICFALDEYFDLVNRFGAMW